MTSELDPAFVNAVLSMAPYRGMSPLLSTRLGRYRFRAWCVQSRHATRIIATEVFRRCLGGDVLSSGEPVFVSNRDAEAIARRLVRAYENRSLRRLVIRSRSRAVDAPSH